MNSSAGKFYLERLKKTKYMLLIKFILGKILSSLFLAGCYYYYHQYEKLTQAISAHLSQ